MRPNGYGRPEVAWLRFPEIHIKDRGQAGETFAPPESLLNAIGRVGGVNSERFQRGRIGKVQSAFVVKML